MNARLGNKGSVDTVKLEDWHWLEEDGSLSRRDVWESMVFLGGSMRESDCDRYLARTCAVLGHYRMAKEWREKLGIDPTLSDRTIRFLDKINGSVYTIRKKSLDVGERVNLFLHSLGAYTASEESIKELYHQKREELDRRYEGN